MSGGRWFRVYDSVLDDPKVQRLPDNLFRAWVNLMCIASRNDGIIPDGIEAIAFSLRLSVQKTKATIRGLKDAALLDDVETGWQPHNWNGRQYKSDVSTYRVKRFRERSKTVSETPPETEQIQSRTEQTQRAFEDFFKVYPRKEKERAAQDAFGEALKVSSSELIIAGARRFASKVRREGTEERFIALPKTWLCEERWREGAPNGHAKLSAEEIEGQNKLRAANGIPLMEIE